MTIRLGVPQSRNQWICLLLGLVAAVTSAVPIARGLYSLTWSKTEARVVSSRWKPGFRVSAADIRYRYAVGGRDYTGDRYSFRALLVVNRMIGRDVNMIVARYPPGEPVTVSVNPSDPSDSVLTPGIDFESLVPFGLGLFLMVLGLGRTGSAAVAVPTAVAGPAPPRPRYRLAWILGLMGAALCLYGISVLYQGIASLSWPSADGRILYSHASTGKRPETLLWYEYHVENQRYVSSKYRTGGNVSPFRDVVEAAAKRYPAGEAVKVYYDPGNPQVALLEPGVWWGNFAAPAIGLLVLAAAWLAKKYAQITAMRRGSPPSQTSSAAPGRRR